MVKNNFLLSRDQRETVFPCAGFKQPVANPPSVSRLRARASRDVSERTWILQQFLLLGMVKTLSRIQPVHSEREGNVAEVAECEQHQTVVKPETGDVGQATFTSRVTVSPLQAE